MSVYIHNVYAHMYLEERGSETFIKLEGYVAKS
jgi:hypothetical protein